MDRRPDPEFATLLEIRGVDRVAATASGTSEQILHHLDARIAGMVQALQAERALERLEERLS
jgi:hypothetical protein